MKKEEMQSTNQRLVILRALIADDKRYEAVEMLTLEDFDNASLCLKYIEHHKPEWAYSLYRWWVMLQLETEADVLAPLDSHQPLGPQLNRLKASCAKYQEAKRRWDNHKHTNEPTASSTIKQAAYALGDTSEILQQLSGVSSETVGAFIVMKLVSSAIRGAVERAEESAKRKEESKGREQFRRQTFIEAVDIVFAQDRARQRRLKVAIADFRRTLK